MNRRLKKIKEFYDQYNIPFKFSVEAKEVLSGLHENSSGNGLKKNSVFHIFVKEEIRTGRLKRDKNSFLCTQPKSYSGGDWSGTLGQGRDELKIIEKYKKWI